MVGNGVRIPTRWHRSSTQTPRACAPASKPCRAHRRYELRQRGPGSTHSSSAARCATLCSAAGAPISTSSWSETTSRSPGRLGGETVVHDRFATATVTGPHGSIDLARARAEAYPLPGALPEVRPAGLADDLARRDFTINAIAAAVAEPGALIDPHGGSPTCAPGCCGSSTTLPSATTRPGRFARPATRRGSASRSTIAPSSCSAPPTSRPSRRTASPPSSRGSRPNRSSEERSSWSAIGS